MARIIPMPLDLSEALDAAGQDRIRQLVTEVPAIVIHERRHAAFQKQAYREQIVEAADAINGLVLEYHYGWHNHDEKYFFAVKSIEEFEALVSVFEVMAH